MRCGEIKRVQPDGSCERVPLAPHRRWLLWRAIAAGVLYALAGLHGGPHALGLLTLGAALGWTLHHSAFGFTSGWRRFLVDRDGGALRAQLVMVAVAMVLMQPVIAAGGILDRPVVGATAPLSVSLVVGAFVFGVAMQLGGGCASGTLYAAGAGSARMLVTLAFFVTGSTIATAHVPWWFSLPEMGQLVLPDAIGLLPGLSVQLLVLCMVFAITTVTERKRHGRLMSLFGASNGAPPTDLVRGPWPLLAGAITLGVLATVTLLVAGTRGGSPTVSRCGGQRSRASPAYRSGSGNSGPGPTITPPSARASSRTPPR